MKCPFCGVETEVPHETQQACIHALQAEIERMRSLLDRSRPLQAGPAGTETGDKDKQASVLPPSSAVKTRTADGD
jgi:hypothetical protein